MTGERSLLLPFLLLVAVLLAAPFVVYPVLVMKILCFALFACAFNLLLGYVGLLSFGHAAFFGLGGYVCGHVLKERGFPPEAALLAASAGSALLGLLFGAVAIRRQGIYFAMVTLALAQLLYFLCLQAPQTGGEDGIQAIPRGHLFGVLDLDQMMVLYGVVVAIFLAGFGLIWRVVHSPFGQVLKATRENEMRTLSLGYVPDQYKLIAFVLSAALAGLAGGMKSIVFKLASLPDVHWTMSGEVVLMALIGGVGTMLGPVVGAAVIVTLQNTLAGLGPWVTIVQGSIFVVCVLAFRRGIVGELQRLLRRPL
ncbi:branched-chain amino acid ABC transporter permease [Zavarzinia sp. CC-PAN008]|uniref:branched-chain amino acid ABC transporter permease n=1 Tax=Zavarzinia sp. CC-PAN008 TaxID=3243332 RepID=UPI003F745823